MSLATPMRRRIAGAAAASLCLLSLTGITSSTAVLAGPYDIDGNVPDTAGAGANAVLFEDPNGSAQELGPVNSNTTKLGVIHTAAKPMLATTNPNAQVDLDKIWLDSDLYQGDIWLYLGWARDSNKGSGVIMYEFQQAAESSGCDYDGTQAALIANCNPFENRQPGDFNIVWDQSGSSANIILRTWGYTDTNNDGDWDGSATEPLTLDAGVSLTGNGDAVAAYSADRFRGEAAVNLSEAVFPENPTTCLTIGNIIPGTVTGNSDTADYKDTVLADTSDFITISNCGSVRVTKDTNPEGGTGQFEYTLSRTSGAAIKFNGALSATGTLTEDGDSETVTDLKAGTGYTLSEDILGGAYDLLSIECDGVDIDAGGTFTIVAGARSECLITNDLQQGTLTVNKVVTNDSGGTLTAPDFHFSVNGSTAVAFEADGSNSMTVNAGTYVVTESDANTRGYATTYGASCAAVIVPAGGSGSCTITNNDQPGTLIVNKVLTNDNGGTAAVTDFSYKVNGGSSVTFEADASNSHTVAAGTYTVVENAASGYSTTYSNCSAVVIALGGSATCTITNNDDKATPSGTTVQSWVLHDSLTLTGVRSGAPNAASATATFTLFSDSSCQVEVGSEEVGVSGSSASTVDGIAVSDTGDYYWVVDYSGDSFNEATSTTCGDEVTKLRALDAEHDDLIAV